MIYRTRVAPEVVSRTDALVEQSRLLIEQSRTIRDALDQQLGRLRQVRTLRRPELVSGTPGPAARAPKRCRVLVVDDDFAIRQALCDLLDEEGREAIPAENGREALTLLRQPAPLPCLILLDLMMPVMDGHQFLRERRRDPTLAEVPTIVVTAGSCVALDDPSVQVLRKPVALDVVLREVERACAGQGRA